MRGKLYLLLVMTTLLSCTGCGTFVGKSVNAVGDTTVTEIFVKQESSDDNSMSEWGEKCRSTTYTAPDEDGQSKCTQFDINFPKCVTNIYTSDGALTWQGDNVWALVGDQSKELGSVDSVDNVFPTYFDSVKIQMATPLYTNREDISFDIDNKEMVNINDYEMCAYTGQITFIDWSYDEHKLYYKAYATKLKTSGAIIYWIVMDESEETEGSRQLVNEYAENMARSLRNEVTE